MHAALYFSDMVHSDQVIKLFVTATRLRQMGTAVKCVYDKLYPKGATGIMLELWVPLQDLFYISILIFVCFGCRFVQKLAVQLFNADNNQAAFRILQDFRKGKFGWIALERPPK